ncbi:hypothetical protein MCAG_02280 [Micromonospora sp. ATCC 39149]|nr:hypothetical protein MCAG_02280 [Micromonospora sp. ATCC 39149]
MGGGWGVGRGGASGSAWQYPGGSGASGRCLRLPNTRGRNGAELLVRAKSVSIRVECDGFRK